MDRVPSTEGHNSDVGSTAAPLSKTPSEWQKEFFYKVLDPDGWRNHNVPWDKPLTRAEFEALASESTIMTGR